MKNGWGRKYRMFDSTPPGVTLFARLNSCADFLCLARYLRLNRWDGMVPPPPPWAPLVRALESGGGGNLGAANVPLDPEDRVPGIPPGLTQFGHGYDGLRFYE
jgi:hypothetical protein